WLSHAAFIDMISACNLIPGPNSTEMALHIGQRRAGFVGLLVAGLCFVVPAALITLGLAWVYVAYGKMPQMAAVLYGIKPVIIAVMLQAVTLAAIAAAFLGVDEMVVLFAAGVIVIAVSRGVAASPREAAASAALGVIKAGAPAAIPFGLGTL